MKKIVLMLVMGLGVSIAASAKEGTRKIAEAGDSQLARSKYCSDLSKGEIAATGALLENPAFTSLDREQKNAIRTDVSKVGVLISELCRVVLSSDVK